jgi:hypothetical protein
MVELSNDEKTMMNPACICIDSAVQSTIAFDRVDAPEDSPYKNYKSMRAHWLIVTNILGTVHAQFGNMLVLPAVYKSKCTNICPATLRLRHAASTLFSNAHSKCLSKTRQTLQSSRSTWTYYGTCANRLPLSPRRHDRRLDIGARFAPCT